MKEQHALEVGVRNGKNFAYYPGAVNIAAIDFSSQMLARAWQKVEKLHLQVDLHEMDVQHLEFSDDTLDRPFATLRVLLSVGSPIMAGRAEKQQVVCLV